jgi:hypothetical protein
MSKKIAYVPKEVLSILKGIRKECRDAIKDCQKSLKEEKTAGNWEYCIGMEHRIDAYDYIDDIVGTIELDIKRGQ